MGISWEAGAGSALLTFTCLQLCTGGAAVPATRHQGSIAAHQWPESWQSLVSEVAQLWFLGLSDLVAGGKIETKEENISFSHDGGTWWL